MVFLCSYGKIQGVKLLPGQDGEKPCALVAFMDIKSASKAHDSEIVIGGVKVATEYNESSVSVTRSSLRSQDGLTQKSAAAFTGQSQNAGGSATPLPTNSSRSQNRTDG